ncbi:MAG: DUF1343 domain-containing protein [Chloroflexi bacterium]|nr:DUF1343 domain-containing protein [Chloroflexota bacterium]
MSVYPAIEVVKYDKFSALQGRKYGLLTHAAATDYLLTPTYDLLANIPGARPSALFSPEHGLLSTVPDGVAIGDQTDPRTRLPVYSLYGDHKKPTADMLEGLDLVVADISDIGTRFYTYIWTLSYMLEACGELGIDVLVLDRPNPLGARVHGLYVEPDSTSFVGRYAHSIPNTHGLTVGELARYFNAEFNPTPSKLTVVSVSGWSRNMPWEEVGLPWILPSPAMPGITTARHYPGSALIEGTTLSEGRGTSLPFEVAGAPGIDGFHLAERLNMLHLQGVRFRPHAFRPTASKHAGKDCQGVQAHITDLRYFEPVRTWLNVIVTLRAVYPDVFEWIEPVNGHQHFDLLIGNTWARQMIEANAKADDILDEEREVIAHFEERRLPYLLYG